MKRFIILILLSVHIGLALGTDYSRIDKQSETVPANMKTAKDIARYLTRNLTTPTDKARAIYFWITHNINYDVSKLSTNYSYSDPQELVDEALQKRKGVCANYASLFHACCQSVGVQSYVIEGYTRQNGKVLPIGHAWNAVKIENQFYNIDATFAAGFVENNKFTRHFRDMQFMILPDELIKTHMPFDPIWQFLSTPVSFKDFDNNNLETASKIGRFNFSDSINRLPTLNTKEKLKREKLRITRGGTANKLVSERLTNLSDHIASEEVGTETANFNQAVSLFNEGVLIYNKYVSTLQKGKGITTATAPKFLEALNASREKTVEASALMSKIKSKDPKLNNEINTFKKNIEKKLASIDLEISTTKKISGE